MSILKSNWNYLYTKLVEYLYNVWMYRCVWVSNSPFENQYSLIRFLSDSFSKMYAHNRNHLLNHSSPISTANYLQLPFYRICTQMSLCQLQYFVANFHPFENHSDKHLRSENSNQKLYISFYPIKSKNFPIYSPMNFEHVYSVFQVCFWMFHVTMSPVIYVD